MEKNLSVLHRYSSNMEQFADAVPSELTEGNGRGARIIHVHNGSGLQFTVCPDRCLDVVECYFRGIPLVFRSPVGYASPFRYEPAGTGWLRNWQAGLLTTVGLRNAGVPNGDFGLHGRISNQIASDVGIRRGAADDGSYKISISGTMRESAMFGEHLVLNRTISTAYGVNEILVEDEITNLSAEPDVIQFVYHCNFGYPMVSPAMRFETPEHLVVPRDEAAAKGLREWDRIPEPTDGFAEQCFFHTLPPDQAGDASIAIANPEIGIRAKLSYSVNTLPQLVQWKNPLTGLYVLGLEPTNADLMGRTKSIANGKACAIAPGGKIRMHIRFSFSDLAAR